MKKNGIVLIGFYENGFRNISTSKNPVNYLSDLIGLKIRTPENLAEIQTIKALGAIPAPMSFSELNTALVQGIVDGQENPLQNIWYEGLYESRHYIAMTHHIYNSLYITANKKSREQLSAGETTLIRDCLLESSLWQMDYMKILIMNLKKK